MKMEEALTYTYYSLLKKQAECFGDKPLYWFEDQEVSYQQFDEKTDIIAKGLERIGVGKGDRVGILLPNGREIVESYYGIWKSSGVSVSLNPMYTEREIEYIVNDSGAKYLITSDIFGPRVEAARPNMPSLEGVIMVSPEAVPDTIPYADIAGGSERIADKGITPDDPAQIMYTSGTTGKPKGAVLPHKGLISTVAMMSEVGYYTENDRTLCALPFFHAFAVLVFVMNVTAGGNGVVIHERFDPQAVLRDFGKYGITIYFGVPTMYSFLLDAFDPSKHDVSKLRLGVTGAAPVPVHVMREFEEKFGMTIIEAYGQTETCGGITFERMDRERRTGSCGHALPGIEVKIVDENDNEVPHGEVGEIIMRGPTTMIGYWNMPEANEETFRNGWLHTGDMGRRDEDGYFYIVDRLRDMIITGGFNIYPKEIEDVLYSHPAVLEATVIGVPDKLKGELAKAYVVFKEGESASEEELDAFCRERLAAYKVPRLYEFRKEPLPKNPQGKILKRVLREENKAQG
jgi:long-chain acyl-CoA synthetase